MYILITKKIPLTCMHFFFFSSSNMPRTKRKSKEQVLRERKEKSSKRNLEQSLQAAPKRRKTHLCKALGSLSDYYNENTVLPEYSNIGKLQYECSHCDARMFKHETHVGCLHVTSKFSTCCLQGKITLPLIKDPPQVLKTLLIQNSIEAKHF